MNEEVQTMEDGVVGYQDDQVDKELDEVEKLKGKYDHLKSEIGRYANQNAELIKQNNELIQKTLTPAADDWDYDPAVAKAEQALTKVQKLELEAEKRELARDFPDYQSEVNSEAFQEWLKESNYRIRRYQAADQMDFDAARELLTEWNEKKQTAQGNQEQRERSRRQALNSASMEKGSAGGGGKKVWDRDWLVEQQVHNPSWYRANYSEIMQAYREGRVKKRK